MQNSEIDNLYLNLLKLAPDELKRYCPDLDTKKFDRTDIKLCVTDVSHRYKLSYEKAVEFLEKVVQDKAKALIEETLFSGNIKIINAVDAGEPMLNVIRAISIEGCHFIQHKVKELNLLGEGVGGQVFEVSIQGYGKKTYAMKKSPVNMVRYHIGDRGLTKKIYNKLYANFGVTSDIVDYFNPDIGEFDEYVNVPHLHECLTKHYSYKKIPKDEDGYSVIDNSYLCVKEIYSEFYISSLVSQAYRTTSSLRFCINFYDVYSLFVCPGSFDTADHIMLMDKISGEYKDLNSCGGIEADPSVQDSFFIQLMFAITYYQKVYMVSHNDLHLANVFIECITSDTEYRGYKLQDYEHFHYSVGGVDVYLPSIPFLVKIGDYGLAVKYGNPIVGDEEVFKDGYKKWIPNQYIPQYDSTYTLFDYLFVLSNKRQIPLSPFVRECIMFLIPTLKSNETTAKGIFDELDDQSFFNRETRHRPDLLKLKNHKTAYDLMQSEVVHRKFGKVRKSSVTLGKLTVL